MAYIACESVHARLCCARVRARMRGVQTIGGAMICGVGRASRDFGFGARAENLADEGFTL